MPTVPQDVLSRPAGRCGRTGRSPHCLGRLGSCLEGVTACRGSASVTVPSGPGNDPGALTTCSPEEPRLVGDPGHDEWLAFRHEDHVLESDPATARDVGHPDEGL